MTKVCCLVNLIYFYFIIINCNKGAETQCVGKGGAYTLVSSKPCLCESDQEFKCGACWTSRLAGLSCSGKFSFFYHIFMFISLHISVAGFKGIVVTNGSNVEIKFNIFNFVSAGSCPSSTSDGILKAITVLSYTLPNSTTN